MAAEAPTRTAWDRFRAEGGWVAIVVGIILGTAGADQLLLAVADPPALGIEDGAMFLQVFLLTFPFAVGVLAFSTLAFANLIRNGYHLLWAALGCLVGGAALGAGLGSAGQVDPEAAALYVRGGSPGQMAESVWWFISAYYQLYGFQFFVAAVVLGVFFGKWGAWLVDEQRVKA